MISSSPRKKATTRLPAGRSSSRNGAPNEKRSRLQVDLAQLDLAAGEVLDGRRRVAADVVQDAGGGQELGRQHQVDAEDVLVDCGGGRSPPRPPHPHHRAGGAEVAWPAVGGGEVRLVGGGDGDEEVAAARPGPARAPARGRRCRRRQHVELLVDRALALRRSASMTVTWWPSWTASGRGGIPPARRPSRRIRCGPSIMGANLPDPPGVASRRRGAASLARGWRRIGPSPLRGAAPFLDAPRHVLLEGAQRSLVDGQGIGNAARGTPEVAGRAALGLKERHMRTSFGHWG
jgi:hypothetical protein